MGRDSCSRHDAFGFALKGNPTRTTQLRGPFLISDCAWTTGGLTGFRVQQALPGPKKQRRFGRIVCGSNEQDPMTPSLLGDHVRASGL